ncbi:MAG: hypothetical protein M3Q74_01050 [Pseudomonadota bacterium]|nr:hypothetical protein [Pseudomonadota bacterium]
MSRTLISIAGFLLAAVTAPAISVTIFLIVSRLTPGDLDLPELAMADVPLAFAVATLIGVIPSVVFGGLTLLAMKRLFRPWPAKMWTMGAGGGVAAAIYSLVATLIGFGPWGASRPWEDMAAAVVMSCVVLSGIVAGLIYHPFAKRG